MPKIGEVAEGKVIGVTDFGAFVQFADGGRGLIHISKIIDGFVKNVSDYLNVNDYVVVKVVSKDKKGNFTLSMKDVPEKNSACIQRAPLQNEDCMSFEKKLAMFLRESEEKLVDLKRNIEAKRGEKRRRR
jgi:S1 RNA binding domain protein